MKTVQLSEIMDLHYGKSLVANNRVPGSIPVYSSSGITGWHNEPLINSEGIIVGRKGTIGTVFYSEKPFYCIDTAYYITPDDAKVDFKFLYYLLKSLNLQLLNEDSAVPGLNRDTALAQSVKLPDKPTQVKRANMLSVLDEIIELNRQMNATLEAIAQAIFKEWFVDFNYPGATGEMVESIIGLHPKGWRVGSVGDFGRIICGKTPSKKEASFYGGPIPFVKIPDMHNTTYVTKTDDSLTVEGANTQKNKYLPTNSILISCIATVGLVSITSELSQTNQQINSIIPRNEHLTFYAFFVMKSLRSQLLELGSAGSATLNVNTSSFANITCLLPGETVLEEFHRAVKPIFALILTLNKEIFLITEIRDNLLSKFMSGYLGETINEKKDSQN